MTKSILFYKLHTKYDQIKPYKHNKLTSDAFEITGINKSPSVASFISNKVALIYLKSDQRVKLSRSY